MKKIPLVLLPFLCFVILSCFKSSKSNSPIRKEERICSSGTHYTLFYKDNLKLEFETSRPDKQDTTLLLCIPAAFTRLVDNTIDGAYIQKGIAGNKQKINHTLGGGIKIVNGTCEIFPTQKGSLINDSLFNKYKTDNASFFQQIQMIVNGSAATFKDTKLFQRRGIAIFKNGDIAIIESDEDITLTTFANDLVKLGVNNLLYTDMGAWDEGWYRTASNETVTIGKSLSQTQRQSNWVVFKK